MANGIFAAGREGFATAAVNWVTDTLKVTAIDLADDTISLSTDDFFNDIAAAARVATATLGTRTATGGVLDSVDTTMTSVIGDQFEALVIWKDTGVESTSRLLIYIDSATSGFPLTPNGGDVLVVWPVAGIATL
jgi:hypothetical protein